MNSNKPSITRDRRNILKLGLGVGLLPRIGVVAALADLPGSLPIRQLMGMVSNRDSAVFVGRRYLDRHPQEDHIGLLVGALQRHPHAHALGEAAHDPAALRAAFGELVRDDFITGRIVDMEGFRLSESELRLCALFCKAAERT